VTNQVCMDRIKLSLKVSQGIVTEARFKANGCPPTIAAASVLTELTIGHPLAHAESLNRTHIIAALGRLPAAKTHCAMLAIDALEMAIQQVKRAGEWSSR
ncbi:MAG TPA: iron-sulfur cluster assembly scaffold protein, partial [Blastocatellia bacterium]